VNGASIIGGFRRSTVVLQFCSVIRFALSDQVDQDEPKSSALGAIAPPFADEAR
jgi:hypothetical protein